MARLLELGEVPAHSRFTRVNGTQLHHLEVGAGRPVVLLQGAGGGAANWYRLLAALGGMARVLALDLPGFGLSQPIEPRRPLGVAVAQLIEQWLDHVGVQRCAIVATSFGSLAALRLTLACPDRVDRLALLNGVGLGRELPLPVRLATLPLLGRLGMRSTPRGTVWLLRRLLTRPGWRLPPQHEHALASYLHASSAAGEVRWHAAVVRMFGGLRGQREILSNAELARIAVPVLLVWGALDPFLPPTHGRGAAAAIPHAVLRLLPRTGHSPNWESPRAVLRVLMPFLAAAHELDAAAARP
jgi:pimeloyl-ACP methyl ester carboxylesterase